MNKITHNKTNFTAGEISTDVLGRTDLRAYENGASLLRNVFIDPIGGVSRRPGLRLVQSIPDGAMRLISFSFNTEQTYLILVCPLKMIVFKNETQKATITTPWTAQDIPFLSWTQSADTLLVVHPNYPPVCITRQTDENWQITNWTYDTNDSGCILQPMAKFSVNTVTMASSGTTGTVTLTASANVFQAGHVGVRFTLNSGEVQITAVNSATSATATVIKALSTGTATTAWKEAAFSPVHGYPVSVTFFQGRLVIGGSRDLPNQLWLSKTFSIMNFDLGTGKDDEAIDFSILSNQVNAIRAVVPGRHLQVFTSGAEWMVSGDPLTPTNIQLKRQTQVGSPLYATLSPIDVSGATLFVSADGKEVREFLFQDIEQAYQAKNISLLSAHLIKQPMDMAYDPARRLVHIVMQDGTMGTLTNYRTEEVLAWSAQETAGKFKAVCVVGTVVYTLVERENVIYLEVLDDAVSSDCTLTGDQDEGSTLWHGFAPLLNKTVKMIVDDFILPDTTITSDDLAFDDVVYHIKVGLPFEHTIVPLPPILTQNGEDIPTKAVRLIEARFRVINTPSIQIDVGNGAHEMIVPLLTDSFRLDTTITNQTTDICTHALGWVRGGMTPLWRITGNTPTPCKIVCVTTQMKASE